ncbi:MAG TPA: serine/threonine-protein phosphatase [Aggregatilineales bacterium]|nr:serine/threonine-protein phosphatase [Anaerolineales bacterium]HRE48265.1 serine/threonine-protein phosphatase [Aggregatilineales bacterium]
MSQGGTDLLGQIDAAGLTDVGSKRQRNEDSYTLLLPTTGTKERGLGAFFIVADGMGGLGGGDTASQAAIDQAVRAFYNQNNQAGDPIQRLANTLESANVFVREQAQRTGLARIGSTASGMSVRPNGEALIFNVGDCRVYRLRDGQMQRLSRDQSVMENQIASGFVTEKEARAARNSMVTAFLGQPFPLTAIIEPAQVQPGDVYLMCSDGLWSLAEDAELAAILKANPAAIAVQKFIKLAISRGGNDNITAIVVRFGAPPGAGRSPLIMAGLGSALVVGATALLMSLTGNAAPPPPTSTPSLTPTHTATLTVTASRTATHTATATWTPTATVTWTPSAAPTTAPTNTATQTQTLAPSATTPPTATVTMTPSAAPDVEATPTAKDF